MTTGKGLAVTLKVRYHRPGFVVSRFFSTALLGRKISFVIPRNSLFIEVRFTSRFHGLRSVSSGNSCIICMTNAISIIN